jgi:tRNA(Ile2) C34 agmatinyltransferase TiaS
MGAFDKVIPGEQVATVCPSCGHQRTQSLAWIRSNKRMTCSRCGTRMDTSPFDTASRSARGGVTDLGKKLSKSTSLRTKGG